MRNIKFWKIKSIFWIIVIATGITTQLHAQWETLPGPYGGLIFNFYQADSLIYASAINGIYTSADQGHSWKRKNLRLPKLMFAPVGS